jgi:hypothetical protein
MGLCLFKTEASNYKLQKSNLQFKLMQNMQRLDDIKDELDRNESKANATDSARAMTAAQKGADYYDEYKKNGWKTAVEEMRDTVKYKQLFAEEQELEFENASIDTELTYIEDMIETFDKGKKNEIKNSGLWCYGG